MSFIRRPTRAALFGLAALGLVLAPACGRRKSHAPDWAGSAPAGSVMALSGQAGWILEQPGLQGYLEQFPVADQALDLFLKKARINPHQETGRISFYLMEVPKGGEGGLQTGAMPDLLIQLGGFRDQAAVSLAIRDAFPAEGSLPVGKRELPAYVILDANQYHIRAVADPNGRVWLGDLRALAKLDAGVLPPRHPALAAAEWVDRQAPLQGFVRTKPILDDLSGKVPAELAKSLPQGVEALAWSVTPGGTGRTSLHRFDLAVTGSPEAMLQVAPWVQRFVAAAGAVQGGAGQAPEILQERNRIGLRCQLSGDQLNQALARLAQPGLVLRAPKP